MNRFIIIGSMLVFGVAAAACDTSAFPSTAPRAVPKADADRTKYDVALAKADGDYQAANQACDALSGSSQSVCKDEAESARNADKARAEQLKPKD